MLLLSPLVACGVPKRGGQTKYPRKTTEFGDSTAGSHGERNISQETHAREQPCITSLSVAVLAGRGARHSESLRGLGGISEATLRLGLGGYPKMSANKIIYKCNKYPKRNFSHEN